MVQYELPLYRSGNRRADSRLIENKPLAAYRFAKEQAGIEGKPVIVGLYTFLKLSKGFAADQIAEVAARFLPVYVQLLQGCSRKAWLGYRSTNRLS